MAILINATNKCEKCKNNDAEIFNVQGSFCVERWQDITYPFSGS
jgi:hypothetical protein